jgi:hypothetical protein
LEIVRQSCSASARSVRGAGCHVPRDWKAHHAPSATPTMPVIPIGFVSEGVVLRYFSMVTSVGTPQTVAAQELRLECMFPADDVTEARHLQQFVAHSKER